MKTVMYGCILVAALILAVTFAATNLWNLAWLSVVIGGLWLAGLWRGWDWSASTGMAAVTLMAAVGIWQGVPSLWMLMVVCAALAGWNLHLFWQRLTAAAVVEFESALVQAHLRRIGGAAGVGLLLGSIALIFEFRLGLGWIFLLGLAGVLSISWVINYLKQVEKVRSEE